MVVSATTPLLPPKPLHAVPVAERPSGHRYFKSLLFGLVFDTSLICINGTQFVFFPLRLIPLKVTRDLYEAAIAYTKSSFGVLCVLMCQWFAPTSLLITTEGMDESILVRDPETGQVVGLNLPPKLVLMANHQVYCDWWYLWAFTYFLNVHDSVLIILKKSLKWVPVVGWGMQFFRFIFLARSWTSDKVELGNHLTDVGKRAEAADKPLTLFIFPEGTLVSTHTRPLSKKYADKLEIADMTNMLLPRSTGLLFSLRTLAPFIPSLHLLDVTIGYPGIPHAGIGQAYYTLRSVFMDGVPPPCVHLHLRLYNVRRDVPIGDVRESDGIGRGADATEEEKKVFEGWLLERWREKDRLMDEFYCDGEFQSTKDKPVESTAASGIGGGDAQPDARLSSRDRWLIPLQLRSRREVLDAFAFFIPALAGYGLSKVKSIIRP